MKKLIIILFLTISTASFSQEKQKVLMKIGDEKVFVDDFKRIYEKNLSVIEDEDEKDIQKNIDLFINYRLKVKEAYQQKLDTLPSYQKEIATYRNQLAMPYLQDSSYINKLVKDAYFRTKNEIKAKHILVKLPNVPLPKDTLAAYEKINMIRKKIINGADFEEMAVAYSEDPSAKDDPKTGRKGNRGNLGYFSAFRMVYPFEEAAYNTKVGHVSNAFRTRFGYHIVKVDTIRPSKGEVEVAHILIVDKTEKGKNLINEIYDKLNKNEKFSDLAQKYSDDTGTKSSGGVLRKFGTGMIVKPFEKVAFSLHKENEYSKPFKTRFGWHIVQLIKKYPIDSFENLKEELLQKVRSSDRAQLSKKVVVDKLKNQFSIQENDEIKSVLNKKNIQNISEDSLKITLFKINERPITLDGFLQFTKNKGRKPQYELYEDFKNQEILDYYKDNLEKTAPDFANTLQEYKDGLLLFELMKRKIWDKSVKDSLGLKTFFTENISKYNTKDLKKVKGKVMNDYQNYIEKNWIADLRKKTKVSINKKQLKKIIKFYQK